MRIEYKVGNALDGPEDAFVHGCNAMGKMQSGIAKEVRVRFPGAYDAYMRSFDGWFTTSARPEDVLGTVSSYRSVDKLILNAVTQYDYGHFTGIVYVVYEAVERAFKFLDEIAPGNFYKLAMPRIGCGLANGNWAIVSEIIERTSTRYHPVVYDLPETRTERFSDRLDLV